MQPRITPAPSRAAVGLVAATQESAVDDGLWSVVDDWLSEGDHGDEGPPSNDTPQSPSWCIQSKGHVHGARFFARGTFGQLGASAALAEALERNGYSRPSCAQAVSYKVQRGGVNDVVLAHPSGSGKTLAYLVPLLQRLQEAEARDGRAAPGTMRSLVLVPSCDLGQQIISIVRNLDSPNLRLRTALVTSEFPARTQRERLAGGVELCVATLGRLEEQLRVGAARLDECIALTVDEADGVYDDPSLAAGLRQLRAHLPRGCTTTLVTSVLAPAAARAIAADLPGAKLVLGRGLHVTRPGVLTRLVDCSCAGPPSEDASFQARATALVRAMAERPDRRTLVLCNSPRVADRLAAWLSDAAARSAAGGRGASHVAVVSALHGKVPAAQRKARREAFALPHAEGEGPTARAGPPAVLVATDRAVRGLDFPAVEHVCLFDFPRDAAEYLRRVGRATRGDGGPARLTMLVVGRQLAFAKALLALDESGKPLALEHERRS